MCFNLFIMISENNYTFLEIKIYNKLINTEYISYI